MKRPVSLLIALCFSLGLFSQNEEAPFKKTPFFPDLKLLLTDSSTWYTKADLPKQRPVMVMVFNPLCDHCQELTKRIVKEIERFKDVHIVMASSFYFDSLRSFQEKYGLLPHKNIVVGYDPKFYLNNFYLLHKLPFIAFYNRWKELISVFEGDMTIEKILKELDQ